MCLAWLVELQPHAQHAAGVDFLAVSPVLFCTCVYIINHQKVHVHEHNIIRLLKERGA